MAEPGAAVVQFPHPGPEHAPTVDDMPWNLDKHRRKFLRCPGRFLDGRDDAHEAEVVFWGEWEPPSRIEQRWPALGRLPRALHRPYWVRPTTRGARQNTDPWVFGEAMRYSNCKQVHGGEQAPTSMQRLAVGSVIFFGSTLDGQFCLDTVFVVASARPWVPAEAADLSEDAAFTACTGEALAAGGKHAQSGFTLYRGATETEPVHGMYSFVPALPATGDGPRFARPAVHLPGLINPASRQSTWGALRPMPMAAVRDAWEAVRHQVLAARLVLAVHLETPPRDPADAPVPSAAAPGC